MYGCGMLGYTVPELNDMSFSRFLIETEAKLLYNDKRDSEKLDSLLEWLSWFTANEMVATGNFKKGTQPMDIKEDLYNVNKNDNEDESGKDKKQQVQEDTETLRKRFGLTE